MISTTILQSIDFTIDDEIKNTDESVNEFVKKLIYIADTHSYMKQLEPREYTKEDVMKIIVAAAKIFLMPLKLEHYSIILEIKCQEKYCGIGRFVQSNINVEWFEVLQCN